MQKYKKMKKSAIYLSVLIVKVDLNKAQTGKYLQICFII